MRDGRVAEVTAGGVARAPVGTEGIDARGKWIVPGLIDMHVHYHPGWMDALFLRHGVTTVRDVGSGLDSILELREASRAPGVPRPRIFACGPLIDGPSPRHGTGLSMSVQNGGRGRAVARGSRSRRGLPEDLLAAHAAAGRGGRARGRRAWAFR